MTKQKPPLFNKVINYLSYRSRSRGEIVSYLQKNNATKEEEVEILEKLKDLNLLDDNSFASELINSQIRKGNGPKKIYFNLLNKQVDKQVITQQLSKVKDSIWIKSAAEVINKKKHIWKKQKGFKQKQKIYALLQYRGHNHKTIKAVIDALPDEE